MSSDKETPRSIDESMPVDVADVLDSTDRVRSIQGIG